MEIVGYADPLSVRPGETVRFMVSTGHQEYRADLVRLIHGAESVDGPGFKEREIASPINTTFPGQKQHIWPGSYVVVANADALALTGSFTLTAWIFPTLPQRDWPQGILTKWHEEAGSGYGVFLRPDGALSVRIGDGSGTTVELQSGVPLRPREWYYVAARYDAERGLLQLDQRPQNCWPDDATACHVERETTARISRSSAPIVIAGYSLDGDTTSVIHHWAFQRQDRGAANLQSGAVRFRARQRPERSGPDESAGSLGLFRCSLVLTGD